MSKGLEALKEYRCQQQGVNVYADEYLDIVEKELKAFNIISQNFRLVGNCLHARNPYAEDGWVFIKELEDEEEHKAWKEMLL